MPRLVRVELLAGATIAALAAAGSALALFGSLTWALAVLCALAGTIGLAIVASHAECRRRDESVISKISQVEADLRAASSALTRNGELLRKLDKRSTDLGVQANARSAELDSGLAEVRRIAERTQHLSRDLYDLRLTIEEQGASERAENR
ncbi:hypothetical protein [Microbacterium sp.]|uniref:hypothetical protein n=1 Tax=Microbacterium sp. TaxID=51671 RepID=UPI0028AC2D5B|nr:hypothetical protein [Microbacterium sp.]